ncbi:hypothetical protein PAXINDRAFT_22648, partial [Paxillus involutus ATCC 200175]
TYQLELLKDLVARGVHNVFHASLLRPCWPNDDSRFPGHQLRQIPGFGEEASEWVVDRLLSHSGKGEDAMFEVQWSMRDVT